VTTSRDARGRHGTVRRIPLLGDPPPRTPTDPVATFDDALRRLVEDMFASMYAAEGVGLAANQIGVSLSVFVYDCPDANEQRHVGTLINPRITASGGELDDDFEGCLSVPRLHYENPRPSYAEAEGVDEAGSPVKLAGTGQFARCLQHETDHLQGVLFLDRLRGRTKRRAMRDVLAADWAQ